MSSNLPNAKLSRLRKPAIIAVILLGLYAICGFLVAPAIIKSKAPTVIAEQLGRESTVDQVRVNPSSLHQNRSPKRRKGGSMQESRKERYLQVSPSGWRLRVAERRLSGDLNFSASNKHKGIKDQDTTHEH
jgi:hypothetical protein